MAMAGSEGIGGHGHSHGVGRTAAVATSHGHGHSHDFRPVSAIMTSSNLSTDDSAQLDGEFNFNPYENSDDASSSAVKGRQHLLKIAPKDNLGHGHGIHHEHDNGHEHKHDDDLDPGHNQDHDPELEHETDHEHDHEHDLDHDHEHEHVHDHDHDHDQHEGHDNDHDHGHNDDHHNHSNHTREQNVVDQHHDDSVELDYQTKPNAKDNTKHDNKDHDHEHLEVHEDKEEHVANNSTAKPVHSHVTANLSSSSTTDQQQQGQNQTGSTAALPGGRSHDADTNDHDHAGHGLNSSVLPPVEGAGDRLDDQLGNKDLEVIGDRQQMSSDTVLDKSILVNFEAVPTVSLDSEVFFDDADDGDGVVATAN